MKVERIIETCLYVTDLDQAYDFYQKILGLESFSRQNQRHLFFVVGIKFYFFSKLPKQKKKTLKFHRTVCQEKVMWLFPYLRQI